MTDDDPPRELFVHLWDNSAWMRRVNKTERLPNIINAMPYTSVSK